MSDTPTEGAPAPEDPTNTPDPSTPSPEPQGDQQLAQVKAEAIKERKARQALERQLQELQTAQLSDQERAVAEAEARGRSAASAEFSQILAAAEIRAQLAGVVPDPTAIVEDLNLSKYLGEDGTVDMEKVAALRTRYVELIPPVGRPAPPSVPTGVRSGNGAAITLDQLRTLSKTNPERVEEMRQRGELQHLFTP